MGASSKGSDSDDENESDSDDSDKAKPKPVPSKSVSKSNQQDSKVPARLQQLSRMKKVLIKQNVDLLESVCSCWETANSYEIQNDLGQKWYTAEESSWFCVRMCCSANRPFTMEIKDLHGEMVLKIQRYWRLQCYCAPCCRQKIVVQLPDGEELGRVLQSCSCCRAWFRITAPGGEPDLHYIKGPCVNCSCCCGDVNYKILDEDKNEEVGLIAKNYGGVIKEALTDADTFTVTFPADCNWKTKSVIMAAAFLIDFMFFETPPKKTD